MDMPLKKALASLLFPADAVPVLIYVLMTVESMANKICSPTYLEECFSSSVNTSLSNSIHGAIPVFDNSSLDWICRSYIAREECITRHERDCPDQHAVFEAKESAIKYLCKEGKNEYIRNRECFQHPSLLNKISVCNITYHVQTGSLASSGTSIDVTRRKLCSYLLEFLNCLKTSGKAQCGSSAGSWLYKFNRQLSSSVLDKMQCPTGGILDTGGIWGIVGGCIIALVCLVVITLLCKRRLEKDHPRGYTRNTSRGYSVASTARKSSTGAASKAYETTYVGTSPKKGSVYLSKQSPVVATSDIVNENSTAYNNASMPGSKAENGGSSTGVNSCSSNKSSPTYTQQETQTSTP